MNIEGEYLLFKKKERVEMPAPPSAVIRRGPDYYYFYNLTKPKRMPWKDLAELPSDNPDQWLADHPIYESGLAYPESVLWEKFYAPNKWERMLWGLPDPLGAEFVAGIILGNQFRDGKCWGTLIGNASSGKTYTLERFKSLSNEDAKIVHFTGKFTAAALWSASNYQNSILSKIKNGGTIICYDAATIMGHGDKNFWKIMSCLREIYDGHFEDHNAFDRRTWYGRVGLIIAATPHVQRLRRYMGMFGDRFIYYNMASVEQEKLSEADLGEYLLHEILPKKPPLLDDIDNPYSADLKALSKFMEITRTSNPLRNRRQRQYEVTPNAHHRIHGELRTLLAGMVLLNGETKVTPKVMKKLATICYRSGLYRYDSMIQSVFIEKIRGIDAIRRAYPLDRSIFQPFFEDLCNFGLLNYNETTGEVTPQRQFQNIYDRY